MSSRPRRSPRLELLAAAAALALSGCATLRGRGTPTAAWVNLAEDRLTDLNINFRQIGETDYVLFRVPQRHYFLEGYVQGMVTDYLDTPIAGVVVTASLDGEELLEKVLGKKKTGMPSATFDPGISNSQGVYRIRFSLPIADGLVDARGRLIYNPQWEQERSNLGKAYEPQRRESPFRIYYDQQSGLVSLTEGLQRAIVQPVFGEPAKRALPGAKAPAVPAAPAGPAPAAAGQEDLLKSFPFGP